MRFLLLEFGNCRTLKIGMFLPVKFRNYAKCINPQTCNIYANKYASEKQE